MHFDRGMLGAGPGGDADAFGQGEDFAVEGIFEADDSGWTAVDVGAEDGVGEDVGEG